MQRLCEVDGDAVTGVVASLKVHSSVYCRTELHAPWGFAVKPSDVSVFHVITEGGAWLEVDDVPEPMQLEVGDVVLLVTGRGHRLADDPGSYTEWLDDILERTPPVDQTLSYGGSGRATHMVCGGFQVAGALHNPLLLSLPPVLRLSGSDPRSRQWVDAFLTLLRVESDQYRPGSQVMLARLADVLVTQTIRTFIASLTDTDRPTLATFRDPRIARAIGLFNSDPAHPWTVEDMASEVAMSRSSFAAAFRQVTGESPIRYLTRCRLARAASLLASCDLTVLAIAQEIGYDSEASLARAFSRAFGSAPGAYRRQMREHGTAELVQFVADVPSDEDSGDGL